MLPLALVLLAGSVKEDIDLFATSAYWQDIAMSPLVHAIKANYIGLYALIVLSLVAAILTLGRVRLAIPWEVALVVALYILGSVLAAFEDPDLALKLLLFGAIFLSIHFYVSSIFADAPQAAGIVLRNAFLAFAAVLVLLNFYEWLGGYGYVSHVIRFFGTSSHPNFLGVQMAVCASVLLNFRARSLITLILKLVLVSGAVWFIYLSGSRTALVVLVTAVTISFVLRYRVYGTLLAIICIALLAMFLAIYGVFGDILALQVYDRGGLDTRSQPWQNLWTSVLDSPLWGHGELPKSSENSFLRGWSAIGISYPIVLLMAVGRCVSGVFHLPRPIVLEAILPVSVFFGLTMGGMFEGYLFDTNSLPIFAWSLSFLTIISYMRAGVPRPNVARTPYMASRPSPRFKPHHVAWRNELPISDR